jgi:signal transduction histidine kinase
LSLLSRGKVLEASEYYQQSFDGILLNREIERAASTAPVCSIEIQGLVPGYPVIRSVHKCEQWKICVETEEIPLRFATTDGMHAKVKMSKDRCFGLLAILIYGTLFSSVCAALHIWMFSSIKKSMSIPTLEIREFSSYLMKTKATFHDANYFQTMLPSFSFTELQEIRNAISFYGQEALRLGISAQEAALNAEKDRQRSEIVNLVAGFVHDLQKPVRQLKKAVNEIHRGIGEFESLRPKMNDSFNQMDEYLFGILQLSRGKNFEPTWSKQNFEDVYSTLTSQVEFLVARNEYTIEIIFWKQKCIESKWQTDEKVLLRIVSNVVENAVNAIIRFEQEMEFIGGLDKSKKVKRYIGFGISSKTDEILINIENNGPQIPQEIVENFGKPFLSVKGNAGGTGLGLFIVDHLTRSLGGSVKLESSALLTRFSFSFPKMQEFKV